jgi:hypothetical protein
MKPIICLAVAITLSGCDLESNPLWIMMTVDKTIVALDDSVRVSLAVTNTSDRTVETHAESEYGPCLPGFEVVDEDGRPVQMLVTCTAELPQKVLLSPGESFQVVTWWHLDISRVGNNVPITAGRYTIRGAVLSDGEIIRSGAFDIAVTE